MTVLRFVALLGTAVCGAAHWVIDHDHRELASRSCGERCNPYWDTCSSSSCSNCEQKAGGSSDDYVCMSDSDAASANISNTIIGLIVLGVICALCGTYCCCCKNKTTIINNQPQQPTQPTQHAAMAVTVPPNCMPGAVLGVTAPTGQVLSCVVPPGAVAGQTLHVPYIAAPAAAPPASVVVPAASAQVKC